MVQIACLGILVADVVGKPIVDFPTKGTLASVNRMELHAGGCAVNTGLSLAKLGVSTAVLGKVGRDGFGDFLVQTLERAGMETRGVARDATAATSATMVAVDTDGERTFLHYTGANAAYGIGDVDWTVIEEAEILHIAGPFLMPDFIGEECAAVLKRAKEMGKITTLDTVWDFTGRWMETMKPSLPYIDYLLPSWEEARNLTGQETPHEIAQVFLDHGVGAVGLKLSKPGAYFRTAQGEERTVPPFDVTAIDALGAGDAWAAGFLCGLSKGWEMEKTITFANAVGACAVQVLGASAGIRSYEDTYQFAFGPS